MDHGSKAPFPGLCSFYPGPPARCCDHRSSEPYGVKAFGQQTKILPGLVPHIYKPEKSGNQF